MREIRDPELLEHYIRTYHIRSFFDTQDLPFRLYEYAPGEIINVVHPLEESIKFFVEGVFDHYMLLEDGTPYLLFHCDRFGFMGDLAFCRRQSQNRYQEVIETVRAVELPLEPLRPVLEQDNRFLRFLLDSMAQQMTMSMHIRTDLNSAEEALLAYLRWRCPNHTITNVSEVAFHINYSRRQIQRVLKSLTDNGTLIRTGKGCYTLRKPDSK
jgi:CRP-like cAMP-binding protein